MIIERFIDPNPVVTITLRATATELATIVEALTAKKRSAAQQKLLRELANWLVRECPRTAPAPGESAA